MFLNYFALGVLIFVFLVLFYGIIAIHDIPYNMAKNVTTPCRCHSYAGWVSLFTLHVIWPFLWIWATLYREDRGWGMQNHITKPDEVPAWMRWPNAWPNSNKSWLQYSPPLIRTRWSANHGSVDYFDLCGIAWAIFKIFRIPVNQWTLATAALGGVFIVAAYSINEL
jgi:hypothetical protein